LSLHNDPLLPAAFAVRCPVAIIYDHVSGRSRLIAESDPAACAAQLRADRDELVQVPSPVRCAHPRAGEHRG
jgi:hypothetical protein